MKTGRLIKALSIIALLCWIAIAGAAQMKSVAPKHVVDAEFKALIDSYYAAWNTLDLEQPDKYYAKDADLTFYDIAPLQYKNWAEYKNGVKQLFTQYSSFKLIPNDDLKVVRHGDVAWTLLTFKISAVEKDGTPSELVARHTAIWEKRGGKWLIVHEHVSVPLSD